MRLRATVLILIGLCSLTRTAPAQRAALEGNPNDEVDVMVERAVASSPTNVWFSGVDFSAIWVWNGQSLRNVGLSWSLLDENDVQLLTGLAVASPTAAWVGTSAGVIYRWNGRTWARTQLLPDGQAKRVRLAAAGDSTLVIVTDSAGTRPGQLWIADDPQRPGQLVARDLPLQFNVADVAITPHGVFIVGTAAAGRNDHGHGVVVQYVNRQFLVHGWHNGIPDTSVFARRNLHGIQHGGPRVLVHFAGTSSQARGNAVLVWQAGSWRVAQVQPRVLHNRWTLHPDGRMAAIGSRGVQTVDTTFLYPDDPAVTPAVYRSVFHLLPIGDRSWLAVEGESLIRYAAGRRTFLGRFRRPVRP